MFLTQVSLDDLNELRSENSSILVICRNAKLHIRCDCLALFIFLSLIVIPQVPQFEVQFR